MSGPEPADERPASGAGPANASPASGIASALPAFLAPAAQTLAGRERPLLIGPLREAPADFAGRRSAVLMLIAGTSRETAEVLVQERSARMRSQPGQFALPGGGAEPADADDVATALREAQEEVALDPGAVRVLGAFAPVPMPWRGYEVVPVLGWVPERPAGLAPDLDEASRLVWAPLEGPSSLTDPSVRRIGTIDGYAAGPAYDLPGDAFVWGFTAHLLEGMLALLWRDDPEAVPELTVRIEVPTSRRTG